MKSKYLLSFFLCIFYSNVCVAQSVIPKELSILTQKIKQKKENYLHDIRNYYTEYKNKNNINQTITVFENFIYTLSATKDTEAIVKICELLADNHRVLIAENKDYIKHSSNFFIEITKFIKNNCQIGDLYIILGILYTHQNLKNYQKGIEYFEKSIEIGKQSACKNNHRNTIFPYIIISKHIYEK